MLHEMVSFLKKQWKRLLVTDLLFKAIAYTLLVPLISIAFRLFLYASGRDILADTDIAYFLIHPLGWFTMIIVGGAVIGISALETGALMTLVLGDLRGRPINAFSVLKFIYENSMQIVRMTSRMVARLLLVCAPFIAVAGAIFLIFLTKYDINFYLTEKPPVFVVCVGAIGFILFAMLSVVIRKLCRWAMALPCLLFEGMSPEQSLRVSRERMAGNKILLLKWIGSWFAVNVLLSSVVSGIVLLIGKLLVPQDADSIFILVTLIGMLLTVWAVGNFTTQIFGAISLALVLSYFYDQHCRTDKFRLPEQSHDKFGWSVKLNLPRLLAIAVVAFLTTSLIGFAAVRTVRLNDKVQVTAHRGASGVAPENTLAAVRQAIEDGTDWVEIDVQESKDGVVVVAHDSDFKKVAGNPMKIWEGTADELRSIDIGSYFDPKFREERVPTLGEVLDACRGNVNLNIELKYYGHTQNLEQKVVELVEEHDMVDHVVIMSLKEAGVQKIKQLRPDWTVGLLTAISASDITRAKVDFLAVSTKLATRAFIDSAHRRNKKVYVWTVNDAPTMSLMIGRGADNLITDYPNLARQVLKERESLSPLQRVLIEFSFLFGATEIRSVEQ